ncbi:E3 ubiquitin-protein ligase PPP1R11-like [Rhagoletis pomonella]|uniref:E3 ubiquitin-protein ligase PPP1R11-like n=1 Tax=Rhagoletis pomonella TaxID=28610 RepID=UPI00177ABACC|nr:E3 ubiquitin-protein ligase PPP1R11-like [Rhagoletis pomonella]
MDTVTMRVGTTEVVVENVVTAEDVDSAPVLRLRLKKPGPDRQVAWREGTVDNEKMGKKKSKCCCIYKKPVNFGESSSSDEEECEHCFGHPEKRRKNIEKHNSSKEPEPSSSSLFYSSEKIAMKILHTNQTEISTLLNRKFVFYQI